MKLSKIISALAIEEIQGSADVDITAVCSDSRKVVPGALFVAVRGYASDGHAYIPQALEKGAVAVICEEVPQMAKGTVTTVKVQNSRKAVALAADAFYGHPSGKLTLVGITGTNGKTTTVTLLYNLFRNLGYPCGLLSRMVERVADTASWR